MIIFISGSINSGKSTVGRRLAAELGYEFIEFDDIRYQISEPDIDKAVPLVFEKGIALLNDLTRQGKSAVVAYPVSTRNYEMLCQGLIEQPLVITLAPTLEVALQDRGNRHLDEWERARIKHHYEIGINKPGFGEIIDNSTLSVDETLKRIFKIISHRSN